MKDKVYIRINIFMIMKCVLAIKEHNYFFHLFRVYFMPFNTFYNSFKMSCEDVALLNTLFQILFDSFIIVELFSILNGTG